VTRVIVLYYSSKKKVSVYAKKAKNKFSLGSAEMKQGRVFQPLPLTKAGNFNIPVPEEIKS